MTVKVSKPILNIREKLSELDKPTGVKGTELMRSETVQDARNLISAGRRNKIINGAMMVSQRATSAADVGAGYRTVDRMRISKNSLSTAEITHEQSTDSPNGFAKSVKTTVTTAEGSVGTSDAIRPVQYKFEGQDVQDLAYGTSDAKTLTLSFYVKSSLTGTYSVAFRNITAGTYRLRSTTYTIDSANTWEKKVISITGDTSTAIINDNAARFEIYWCGGSGTDFTSSNVAALGWADYASGGLHYGQTAQLQNTLNATFLMTGIQLEIGENATEFEHRSIGEEIELCRRYYSIFHPTGQEQVYIENSGNKTHSFINFPVPYGMRTEPSVTLGGTWTGHGLHGGRTIDAVAVQTIDNGGLNGTTHVGAMGRCSCRVTRDSTGTYTSGQIAHTDGWDDGVAWLIYEAEI